MFGVSVANKTIPPDLYRPSAFALDLRGLAIMLSLALLCTLVFGLLPALRFARVNLADAMRRDGGTSSTSRANLRLQSSFVVAQVAMTIVLLSGTLLVGRSVNALGRVAPGFEASGVLTVQTILSGPKYSTTDSVRQFQDAVLGHVSNLPDVTAAAFVNYLPLNHEYDERQIDARGPTPGPGERLPSALTLVVSAAYFDLLRIPLQEGRTFAERDRAGTEPVAVISRSMATRYWPNESPIGRTFTIEKKTAPLTIVGIVADSLQVDLAERGRPQVFLPQAQDPTPYLRLLVRAAGDPAAAAPAVSRAVHTVDPYLPVTEVQPLSAVVEEFLLPQRALRGALLKLGAFSVALAVLGIYGIVACFVTERTREFGIRAALGASRRHIVGLVAGRGLRLAIRGVLIGLPAAVLAGYLLRGLLFGVGMGDPLTYLAVSAIAVGIALAASITPARRAARLDPVQAIRAP
jgi:predicted permease